MFSLVVEAADRHRNWLFVEQVILPLSTGSNKTRKGYEDQADQRNVVNWERNASIWIYGILEKDQQ